jgi:hypothetical protein
MPDEPPERPIRDYIANGAVEGAMSAAQQITGAAGVALSEVLAAVQKAGLHAVAEPGAVTVTFDLPTAEAEVVPAGEVFVYSADEGRATDGLSVVRQADVEKLGSEASRGKLPAVLQSANRRILVAVVLLAAIYPVLPPEVQTALRNEGALMSALTAILALLKR